MSAETIAHKSDINSEVQRDQEPIPTISYAEYRELCDERQPDIYRKTGIDSQENYESALEDPSTVFLERNGQSLPLFVSLENAGGYNIEGTRHLTGKEFVYTMALPVNLVDIEELVGHLNELDENVAVVVQTAAEETGEIKAEFAEVLTDYEWRVGDFLDPRCPEGYKTARVSIYSAQLAALDDEGRLMPFQNRSQRDLFEEDRERTGDMDVELITAQDIRDDPQLFEQLWDLHNDRFNWLGEYHPISMQETKTFFQDVVSDDHTTSFVRFDMDENGKRIPVCHGCFVDNLDLVDWLNDRFKNETEDLMREDNERVQFFYGIASRSKKSSHYAKDVMQLHSRINKMNGGLVRLMFESTNKSSLYIPRMVGSYVSGEPNGIKITEDIKTVSQLDYWYLASGSKETV